MNELQSLCKWNELPIEVCFKFNLSLFLSLLFTEGTFRNLHGMRRRGRRGFERDELHQKNVVNESHSRQELPNLKHVQFQYLLICITPPTVYPLYFSEELHVVVVLWIGLMIHDKAILLFTHSYILPKAWNEKSGMQKEQRLFIPLLCSLAFCLVFQNHF